MKTNILAMLAILPVFAFDEATADSETVGGYTWSFTVSGNSATVTGVSPASGDVAIPSTLGGKSATSIENYAFWDCSGLTSITVPDSVTSIGSFAFEGCSGLTSITIPDSVTSIGGAAFSGCSGLTSITIPNGVTSIGDEAFRYCSGLTSVTIPASVTSIGDLAFEGCSGLTSITVPDGVTGIGSYAFNGCSGLTNAVIGNSVTSIGEGAFIGCYGLTSITIPDSVTSIGNYAFQSCSGLTSITIPDGVTSIGDSAFSGCSGLTSVTIPNGVTSIGNGMFYNCSGLTSITIPNGVTSIGDAAFYGCSGLTSVTIPDSVTSIEAYAFCYCSGLTSIKIPDSVTSIRKAVFSGCSELYDTTSIPGVRLVDGWAVGSEDSLSGLLDLSGVRGIGFRAFYERSGITSVVIPNGLVGIGIEAFYDCSGLTAITIPDSVSCIEELAFCGCSGLTSITIPDGVTSIGDFAFQSCSGLTSITIGSGVTCIGNYAFQSCSGLTSITIPDGVTSIGHEAFSGCSGLTSVTIPNGVTSIGDGVFYNCSGLTSITIPNGVTNIGIRAFYGCSGLTSVTIPDSVTSIGYGAFEGCSGLTSITIPNGVSSIEYCAFFGCSGLTSIKIPDSVTSIGERVFYGCSELYDTTSIPGVRLVDGWAVGSEDSLSGFLDLSGVRGIGFRAFYERSGITSVVIPNGLVGIGVEAFEGCSGLTSITIPDSVSCIEEQAFSRCSGLTSITIGSGVTSIGYSAFDGCALLRLITISDNWPSIGGRAFRECPLDEVRINISDMARWATNSIDRSLEGERIIVVGSHSTWIPVIPQRRLIVAGEEITNLVIPDGVTSIANSAFYKCSRLTSVTIPGSVTNIGDSAFSDCSGLTSITIGSGVTSIGGSAFYKCSRLTSVTIPDGVTSIGWRAFSGCSGLTSITIPASVTSIGDEAFSGCSGLTSITIPDGVTSIGSHAFSGCSGLTSITIPASVTSIGSSAFSGCSGLTSVTISNSVTSIGSYAFSGCSGLTSVTIPDGVTSIGEYVFSGCSGLTSVTIPDSVTNIMDHVFYGCSGLTSISVMQSNASYDSRGDCNAIIRSGDNTLIAGCRNTVVPHSVTRIGYAAFSSCSGLTSITIPDSVTSIGSYAFSGCSELTSVTIPASVTSIGYGAFEDCIGLKTLYLPDSYPETPTVPSGCTIVRFGEAVEMSVLSPVGYPIPGVGSGIAPSNIVVACSAPSPVEECGWRYVCMGWRGTGSVPANGTSNAVDVLMLEDSSIEWIWETNVWIECTVSGDASPSGPGSGWFPKDGAAAVFSFAPAARPFVHSISGDTDGVSVDAAAGTVTIPSDRPRKVVLRVPTCREAVGTDGRAVEWAQGDGNPWFVVEDATSADGLCLRSGAVAENPGTNALETTVTGPGRLSFSWKMTNTRNDYARFYVDGAQQAQISRTTTAWALAELELDAGPHTLRWAFERGGSSADGAAFLDDVRWIPRRVLTVSSADGTPVPAVGSHDVDWGTEIAASVAAPAASGGTRRVCTGWTGTGSVPASGTGTSVAFTVEEDSTLAWNWRTEHWIDVAVAGGGSTSFLPQWVEDGMTLSVDFSPNWTLYDVALSGDTEGVTISGSTLVIPADGPRTIRVTITERKVSLTVATSAGTVTPAPGVHSHSWGDSIAASAVAPPPETAGVQIVCTGWTGTGSVPASGTRSNVSFTITRDSSIEWKWVTNVWIDVAVTGDGSTDFAPKWVRKGSTETIGLVPSTHLFDIALSGDVADGVTLDGTTLSVTADKPRHIVATITERKLSLSVSSAFGTVTPSVGAHSHSWGDPVTASAKVPTTVDGTRHVLLGWTGTGSVPASGSGSSVSFTMEESSSIAWRWRTERRISLETAGPVATDFSAGWFEDGTTLAVSYDVLFGDGCAVSLSGDTNGVVHDANARTLSIPCDRVRALRLVAQPPPALTLAEALDSPGLVWTSGGDNAWAPQTSVTADGEDAAASGDASGGESVLSTVLTGPGTLSWSWRLETTGGAGIDLEVDDTGNPRRLIESDQAGSWIQESFSLAGAGTHDVRFVFWNEAGSAADRGFLDGVSWTGAVAGGNETWTTPEPVPHAWLVAHGLAPAGTSAAAYESAALAPARNGRPVWECYVAGLDPTKDEDFLARIEMEDGEPRVLWTPSNVAERAYTVYGKALLTNEWSSPVNASHRFFQVRVALGGASGVDESAWPGSVVVTFDPAGGSVDPATRTYDAPGTLGALPTPVRDGFKFLGWWTREAGGVEATAETAVPWSDWTLHARWLNKDPVALALNPDLVFTKGGDADWFAESDDTHDGVSAARSGAIAHGQSTWIETTVTGSGTISFWWKVSSEESFDGIHFMIDGVQKDSTTGTGSGWTKKTFPVFEDGSHTVRWTYAKNESNGNGSDCGWVDEVVWTPCEFYTISFDSAGGSPVSSITAAYGEAVTAPAAPTKEGYTFAGWSPAFPATMPLGGAALTATWTPRNYSITFDSAGGDPVSSITAAYGEAVTAPAAPTKEGYTFAGWSPAFPATMPLGGAALTATWAPRNYSITFDSAGGSAVAPITAAYGETVTAPAAPTKEGYTFVGWSPAFPATMPLGGAALTARWEENVRLSIAYYDHGDHWNAFYGNPSSYFSSLTPALTGSTADFGDTLDTAIGPMGMVDVNRLSEYGFRGFFSEPDATVGRFHGKYASDSTDHFWVRASGTISISTGGSYSFGLAGDDFVALFIDGVEVCRASWGYESSGKISLSAGKHDIDIAFCELSGGQGFFVQWKKPGDTSWSPLPQSILSH